jgi:cytochrome c-type biogenesis protein CcmH/NrfG
MIVCVLVGFIAGAVTGIKFVTKETQRQMAEPPRPEVADVPSSGDMGRLEGLLRSDPNNLRALISLGNLYFDTNQYQKATDMYGRALTIDPENADVRTDMAIMYRNLKEYDRAVQELKAAAAQDLNHVNSRFNLGIVLLHDKKDLKGTIAAWEDYLRVEPTGERAAAIRKQLEQLRATAK